MTTFLAATAVMLVLTGVVMIAFGLRDSRPVPRPAVDRSDGWSTDRVHREREPSGPALADNDDRDDVGNIIEPAAPLVMIETRPFAPLVEPTHESTGEERRACREHLGHALDPDLDEVIRLLQARPPELRGMLMTASAAEVAQELAVLRAYLRGALPGLDDRLREGATREQDRAATACLVSGLRRMPVHHGAVFHRAPRLDVSLEVFFPGSLLIEPAFVRADRNAFPPAGIGTSARIDYVIWSESGRLTPLLVGHSDTVMFSAVSRLRVLSLEQTGDHATVFLAEESESGRARSRPPEQILEHLRTRAAAAGVGPIDGPAPAPAFHPGVDQSGRPFALSTAAALI